MRPRSEVMTALCVYQTAMPIKLGANARNKELEMIVPAQCVQTYDVGVETAKETGALPDDGELLQAVFLYHLQRNGARMIRRLLTQA